jgi:hypothetical protein
MEAAVWMTGYQRKRLQLFGDVLFVDGTFANIQERFQLFMPSVVNENKKLLRVCYAVAESENVAAIQFLLQSIREMCATWEPQTLILDSKFSPATILEAVPNVSVQCCTWHWLHLDVPAKLRHTANFESLKTDLYELKDCRSEEMFESMWVAFSHKYPQSLAYLQSWYAKKETWCCAWTFRTRNLAYQSSSPAESSNATFKAWMGGSDANLISLLLTR